MLDRHKILKVIMVIGALAFYIPILIKGILYFIFVIVFPVCGIVEKHSSNSPSGKYEMTVAYSDCAASSIDTSVSIKNTVTNRDFDSVARFKGELPITNFTWEGDSVVVERFELEKLIYLQRYSEFRIYLRPD